MTAPSELYRDSGQPVAEKFQHRPTPDEVAEASKQFMAASHRLPTLFDLEDAAYQLLTQLEGLAEGTDETVELNAQLALIDQMLMDKTESYVSVICSLESMSGERKAQSDRLKDRAKTAEKHAEWLKARLLAHLQSTGRERVETSRFSISIRLNNPSVVVLDAAAIPSEFQRTKVEITPDKVAILAAFKKDGEIVPGTSIERTPRLSIT